MAVILEDEISNTLNTLLAKGFRQSSTSNWLKPSKEYEPTERDIESIDFLCLASDSGGLAGYMITEDKAMEFSFIINI